MIYLVRHGETDWNRRGLIQGQEDVPLNLSGIQQAMEGRALFKDSHLKKVVTSPLSRASKTAKMMTSQARVDSFSVDPRLIEYDFGPRSGTNSKTGRGEETSHQKEEDEEEFLNRVLSVLTENALEEGNVALFTHGAVIGTIIRSLLPEEYADARFPLENCSVTAIETKLEDNKLTLELRGINMPVEEVQQLLKENEVE